MPWRALSDLDKQLVYVTVPVIHHKENVIGFQLILRHSPLKLWILCPGQNETVKNNIGVGKAAFDIFDTLVKLHLVAGGAFVE